MKAFWTEDTLGNKIQRILTDRAKACGLEIQSVILFGPRVQGRHDLSVGCELLILLSETVDLESFIQFENHVRLQMVMEKMQRVNTITMTPSIFRNLLYKDEKVGTYLFMISRANRVLYDPNHAFATILHQIHTAPIKQEEQFIRQCITFAKDFESEKWEEKWEKALMHLQYKRRRT